MQLYGLAYYSHGPVIGSPSWLTPAVNRPCFAVGSKAYHSVTLTEAVDAVAGAASSVRSQTTEIQIGARMNCGHAAPHRSSPLAWACAHILLS